MKKSCIFILIFLIFFTLQSKAQDLIRANPADLDDPHSLFINPAVVPFQNLAFNLGMKVYHVGFISENSTGLKHSYSSNSFPNFPISCMGVGLTLENFYTPFLNTMGIGVSMGYSVSPIVSFGVSATGYNTNYDLSNSNLTHSIDIDPVLQASKDKWKHWNVSFGAGVLVRPNEHFTFGIGCNHFNQPDISIIDAGVRKPIEFDFGIKYYYNDIFGVSLFSNYQQDELMVGIITEANLYNKGALKTGYYDRSLLVEGQLKILTGLSLHYRMEYPLYEINSYSYGSHQLGVSWNMKHNPKYTFNIAASADTVKVIKERSMFSIEKSLTENLEELFSYLDYIDFEFPEDGIIDQSASMSVSVVDDPEISLHEERYEQYREDLKDLITGNSFDKNKTIAISYPDDITAERALRIKNYLIQDLGLKEENIKIYKELRKILNDSLRQVRVDSMKYLIKNSFTNDKSRFIKIESPWTERLVPHKIVFHITNVRIRSVREWRIVIRNTANEVIRVINGYHQIPDVVEWDGFTNEGILAKVGNYYYQFQYSTSGNRWLPKKPENRRMVFINTTRERIVEFNSQDKKFYEGQISIRLKKTNKLEGQ